MKIVVVGGGASGLVASIYAKTSNNEVILLDKNNSFAKKLLITGNGRCNYTNSNMGIEYYNSSNLSNLKEIINTDNHKKMLSFFEKIGIIPKIKNGYYYPYSNQASSIKTSLVEEAKLKGVIFKYNFLVNDIIKDNDKFKVISDNETIICDKVIMAPGSKAGLKNSEEFNSYDILKKLGHNIIPVMPSLCGLEGFESYFKKWDGIRSEVEISLFEGNNLLKKEVGEVQLTNYGISGICTYNLSSLAAKNIYNKRNVHVEINFIPFIKTVEDFKIFLKNQSDKQLIQLLEGILNYKLIPIIINNSDKYLSELKEKDIDILYKNLSSFYLDIKSTLSFDKAQVCSGGVSLDDINIKTMESNIVKGLYIIGEVLDVDGECGGYNLTFSFITGMIAGNSIGNL